MRGWTGLFSSAFAHSRTAMALVDERRRHVDVNGAYLRLLGYPRDQLVGRLVWEFMHDGPRVGEAEWTAALAEGRFTGETGRVTAHGAVVAVQWGRPSSTSRTGTSSCSWRSAVRAGDRASGASRRQNRRTSSCRRASARSSASCARGVRS